MWVGLSQDNNLTDLEAGSADPGQGLESIGPPTAEDSLQPTHKGTAPVPTGSRQHHQQPLLSVALELNSVHSPSTG